ncbi:hypothetical protein PACILC2_46280 [Paenibacillus cisolokensis]|uniref:Uncharacterized protein n=1 Tax=Paenibacillus cisolokensis TaxID=1658519 RepID=A0ABQ4NCU9_9BACL|nr:hypothetical protein [Paenibacillus cisolokensis]GIQ66060.1 hypothetical protein PACILC2_46280 [Paenibacillus cisolokensis]
MRRTLNESMKVLLLHSNDIHSRLEQAAKMAGYIADQRRVYGSDRVLVSIAATIWIACAWRRKAATGWLTSSC